MVMVVRRFEVWLVNPDPAIDKEIKKIRPCLIVSPDESNKYLDTVVGVPMTTIIRTYPTRIHCVFQKKKGQVAIDQIRSLDKTRLVKKVGILNDQYCKMVCKTLLEYFAFE
jgi:mRNA interferase MazF